MILPFGLNSKSFDVNPISKENTYFNLTDNGDNTYIISSLKDNNLSEYRFYSSYVENDTECKISGISPNLFNDLANDASVMVSKYIENYNGDLFSNEKIKTINFTGSKTEWDSKNVVVSQTINYYAFDEGFVAYWCDFIRPTPESDICSISKETYQELRNKYDSLSLEDRYVVNEMKDYAGESIEDTMIYLSKYFSEQSSANTKTKSNLPQDMTLGIIVSIAIFGMTTICIFYILKKEGIIN